MAPDLPPAPSEFDALVKGHRPVDLARIALEIARDAFPLLDVAAIEARLDEMAARVRSRVGDASEPWLLLEAITAVLFREEGLRGNDHDYYDPRNSYLHEVLRRRIGVPISLGIVCIAVAERSGLALRGVNLPAHFMLRHETEDGPVFIDPFHGGCLLDKAGVTRVVGRIAGQDLKLSEAQFSPCPAQVIVRRLLYNLKLIHLRDRRMTDAVPVLKRLVQLSPETPGELRDLGIVCFYGDRRDEAETYLKEYLRRSPYADDAYEIRDLLRA